MDYCIECKTIKVGKGITFDRKCTTCGSNIYTEEEIQSIYNMTHWGGWRTAHDLFDIREKLYDVKRDPLCETADNELWIDVLIDELEELENKFINKYVKGE